METRKRNHKTYTATCHSPFAEVQKQQSVNGDDEKTIRRIRLHVILHLQKCRSSNPLMETMKKNHKSYTATCTFSICRSVEVAIHQWRQGKETIRHTRLPVILHLQKCRSSNPLMETMKKTMNYIRLHVHFSICRSVEVAIH